MSELKWRIGQVWKCRDGVERTVTAFNNRNDTYCIEADGFSFTRAGMYYDGCEDSKDLQELVKDSDGLQLEDADPAPELQEEPAAPISAADAEFRDRLIIDLAPRAIGEHMDGSHLMDFIDAIMARRAAPKVAA